MGSRSQQLIQPIELLKNVYSLAASDSDWMGIVLRHCEGAFDSGEGVFGYLHDASTEGSASIAGFHQRGTDRALQRLFQDLHDIEPSAMRRLASQEGSFVGSCSTAPVFETPLPRSVERLGDEGVADSVTIVAIADDKVLCLGSPATDFIRLPLKVRRQWESLMPHVSAAFRLRTRFGRWRQLGLVDPVRGAVDAEGSAVPFREELLQAARDRDVALGRVSRLRSDGPASALFPALVAGRFSLVDQWDADGKRHVVVLDNPEKRVDPRALTTAELRIARGLVDGESTKEMAHSFDVSVSTVTTLASKVYEKLGVRNRGELRILAEARLDQGLRVPAGEDDVWLVSVSTTLPSEVTSKLTAALVDVLGRVVAGKSTAEIARARKTSVSTVEKQITRIYGLLRLRCRGDLGSLFRYGERHGKPTSCSRARFE
jgi:DNA-binding NarL/FixJ family response regulator